jgi:multisite-specific tRNA:(cytosine-C5)-methyltransferase
MLLDPNLIKNLLGGEDFGIKITPTYLTNLPLWKDLVFNINIPRMELKKNANLANFHKLIQKSVDAGLMSRQEAVSMIPPMLMQVEKTDRIFDMCAAPGSKTAQFLEVFYKDFDFLSTRAIQNDEGFVLANDNNWNRAHMMTHQLKRLNTAGMAVINHDAQFYPFLYQGELADEKVLFDKILADVPCSSDAVLRKLPHKWKKWSPKDSFLLHKLQLLIINKGISLLKPGGTIVYSTCSLNPIENEAVVHEVMRTHGDTLEIVDMSEVFVGSQIKNRPGLLSWKVYVDDKSDASNTKLIEIKNIEDPIYEEFKEFVEKSCFPPESEDIAKKYKLQNCIRLFPHDSDTSGFFITVFKKSSQIVPNTEKPHVYKKPVNPEKGILLISETNQEIINWLQNYYGMIPKNSENNLNINGFPFDQLATQSKIYKKLNFISKGLLHLMKSDRRNQLKLINLGVKLFSLNKRKIPEEGDTDFCKFRICQDGLIYLLPFMSKRIYFCDDENLFIKLIKVVDLIKEEIEDIELRNQLNEVKSGCIVFVLVNKKPDSGVKFFSDEYYQYLKENYKDAVTCYISAVRLSTMINKEHQHVFNLKFKIE